MTDNDIEKRLDRMTAELSRLTSEQARQGDQLSRLASEQAHQGDQLSRAMVVVSGSPDFGTEPIVKRMKSLEEKLDKIIAGMERNDAEQIGQNKLLGFLGMRDIPLVIALISAIYTLGGKLGWWQ
mgnify:CR=1 FL=1